MTYIKEYENAFVFHNLTSFAKYYVYLYCYRNASYRIRLTYGFNWDANMNHTVTELVLGDNSKDHLLLQPG